VGLVLGPFNHLFNPGPSDAQERSVELPLRTAPIALLASSKVFSWGIALNIAVPTGVPCSPLMP